MLKRISLIIMLLFLSGCSNVSVSSTDIQSLINTVIKDENFSLYNINNIGYRYYLPRNFNILSDSMYNQTFINEHNKYYLYVDILSYYNKSKISYNNIEDAYYQNDFQNNSNYGFIQILENNSYFYIKMMYNYAIIEVRVEEREVKDAIVYATTILSSIKYNESVISNLVGDNILEIKEKKFILKGPRIENSKTYLEILEEFDYYEGNGQDIKDPDLIN